MSELRAGRALVHRQVAARGEQDDVVARTVLEQLLERGVPGVARIARVAQFGLRPDAAAAHVDIHPPALGGCHITQGRNEHRTMRVADQSHPHRARRPASE